MSVPDELVQAAAEAGHDAWASSDETVYGQALWEKIATAALQAAFAKLGECEEAVALVAGEMRADNHFAEEEAREILATLAKAFGGRDG